MGLNKKSKKAQKASFHFLVIFLTKKKAKKEHKTSPNMAQKRRETASPCRSNHKIKELGGNLMVLCISDRRYLFSYMCLENQKLRFIKGGWVRGEYVQVG